MQRYFPFALGIVTGAAMVLERDRRRHAERLAAALLETLLNAVDANDPMTGAHVRRVARYSLILADAADLDEHTCHSIERVALFHDIGKIHEALFDIIHESAKLTPEEREKVATHPQRGAEVLAPLAAFYPDLADGVIAHHERWDGTGYPRALRGVEIPLAARVVAIADSFDAITHSRRYSHGRSSQEAADAIASGRAAQFDPELVDLFLSPPILDEVLRSMREAHAPRTRPPKRTPRATSPAPDLTFRWRSSTPAPLPPGRPPQRST